ncbi:MAG: ABC transporter permease [Pyrinomonadaceae bacterium]
MLELVFSNLRTRPFRALISVFGVALGVILINLFTGLSKGMSEDMARRATNWKAEVMFSRPGAMSLTGNNASVNTLYAQKLLEVPGVESTVPVYKYMSTNSTARWGVEQIDGIDWAPYAKMNEMKIVSGRPAVADNEIIVDERKIKEAKLKLGDSIEVLGNKFTLVGVFSPPSGARMKMTLGAMQNLLDAKGKCSFILVKVKDGADPAKVAKAIDKAFPENIVNLTSDLFVDSQQRIPGLKTFTRVLVGLGAFVSIIFVLLSMYTTITERRKEIGILKSLGASKSFVMRVIEGEALLIGILGAVFGLAFSFLTAFIIERTFELPFIFSSVWIIWSIIIAIGGSLLGALYPASRASEIDPVLVLTNE